MHEFWYDYLKPQYRENVKLGYMDTDSLIVHVKQIFTKILQKILKKDLMLCIMNETLCCLKEKMKK